MRYDKKETKKERGFTIVELLIVIVVIAILAVISIVAYVGVQNSANDTVVKNDLANFAKKVEMVHAETGGYPEGIRVYLSGSNVTGSLTDFPADLKGFALTKGSCFAPASGGFANFIYCKGVRTDNGQVGFSVLAESTSRKQFRYSSMAGLQGASSGLNASTACAGLSYPRSASYGYLNNSWYIDS